MTKTEKEVLNRAINTLLDPEGNYEAAMASLLKLAGRRIKPLPKSRSVPLLEAINARRKFSV